MDRTPPKAVIDHAAPKAEFFSMYINSNKRINLYGTITVEASSRRQYLFSRSKEECEYKQPGSTPLLLIGPTRYVSALDIITVVVDLKDSDSEEEIKGLFSFLSSGLREHHLVDHPLCQVFDGKYGSSLRMYYSVFSHAVQATVEVLLTRTTRHAHDAADAVKVDGQIIAQNSFSALKNDTKEFQTVLKEWSLPVVVSPGDVIELSRPMVAVPFKSILTVSANLRDECGNQIARGLASFSPKMRGDDVETISGKHGEIRVTISWRVF